MFLGIDHLVIVVSDLAQASRDFTDLGFTVVPGGRHPVGSHNVIIPFADGSYVEIIAFYRKAVDHRWWDPLQDGERLVDYCLQTDDLRGDTLKLRAAGVDIKDPVPWSRTRPDGYELKWLLSLAGRGHRGVAPFLIEDVTPRRERIPQQFNHKNGTAGIAKLTVAVGELSNVGRWYQNVLGLAGKPTEDAAIGATGLRFIVGPHVLEFLSPVAPQSPLIDWLRAHGPSPYSAELHSAATADRLLDPSLAHGAQFYLTK
jgi:catechol 2,3-dioxygenase-like lactoylglutathione lyase family enzyme